MPRGCTTLLTIALLVLAGAGIGCSDKPHSMGRERPPVDELYGEDEGLQSKDVVNASDAMAQSLLSDPRLNGSKEQWVMVVDRVQMDAVDARGDLDIFLRRLKVNLDKFGKGRVTFVENRDKLRELQSRELDAPKDTFGQGQPAGNISIAINLFEVVRGRDDGHPLDTPLFGAADVHELHAIRLASERLPVPLEL